MAVAAPASWRWLWLPWTFALVQRQRAALASSSGCGYVGSGLQRSRDSSGSCDPDKALAQVVPVLWQQQWQRWLLTLVAETVALTPAFPVLWLQKQLRPLVAMMPP